MKIFISTQNSEKIETALKEVNGRATTHAYTRYSEIEACAKDFRKKLRELGLVVSQCVGATYLSVSG